MVEVVSFDSFDSFLTSLTNDELNGKCAFIHGEFTNKEHLHFENILHILRKKNVKAIRVDFVMQAIKQKIREPILFSVGLELFELLN